jgi:hypothetical protein
MKRKNQKRHFYRICCRLLVLHKLLSFEDTFRELTAFLDTIPNKSVRFKNYSVKGEKYETLLSLLAKHCRSGILYNVRTLTRAVNFSIEEYNFAICSAIKASNTLAAQLLVEKIPVILIQNLNEILIIELSKYFYQDLISLIAGFVGCDNGLYEQMHKYVCEAARWGNPHILESLLKNYSVVSRFIITNMKAPETPFEIVNKQVPRHRIFKAALDRIRLDYKRS